MARTAYRPGRTLVVFFLGVALLYGLVALAGSWKPELGLDLQGGTRITLQAKGDPTDESLDEARSIIDQRVNGSGVTEAEVVTEGGGIIAVEIPGEGRRDLVETVKRQAQLRFRLVACSEQNPTRCSSPGLGGSGNQLDGVTGGSANRPPANYADEESPTDDASEPATGEQTDQGATDGATESPSPGDEGGDEGDDGSSLVQRELNWMRQPSGPAVQQYNEFSCSEDGVLLNANDRPANLRDDPDKPLVACSEPEPAVGDDPPRPSIKYLLSRAVVEGTELDSASAGIPQNDVQWVVNLEIGGEGQQRFAEVSQALYQTEDQFAIVLDRKVLSAPTMEGIISNGRAQISGNFTEASANSLATSLKFGALPIEFEEDVTTTVVGPSLAGNQLTAGMTAGGVGLALVMLYCMVYYRGLGSVVLSSLVVAAAIVYGLVLLLSEAAGFTLTLPGIAGLIIAVGITADSFIVLFERMRDEMRDGKSVRVAVESAWVSARNTALAADAVSLLAALVLYIFAAGTVKGFAFALGLTTMIDIIVFFFFTHPFVSWLARFRFFSTGHRLSGLSPETLGMETFPAGGKA